MVSSFEAVDGAPGTGKTREIVEGIPDYPFKTAVITYTTDAAHVLAIRAPLLETGTIYSLTWKEAAPYSDSRIVQTRHTADYSKRRIDSILDTALTQYVADSPSRRERTDVDDKAEELHAWRNGPPPFNLAEERSIGALKYILPLARMVEAGKVLPEELALDLLIIDEAQDMSWLELRAAMMLVSVTGRVITYGDPGQSIFAHGKGMRPDEMPPVWQAATKHRVLNKGWRVGPAAAELAAGVLRSYYDRPASAFAAEHETTVHSWDPSQQPRAGLVLGYSRYGVSQCFERWNLQNVGVMTKVGKADLELVLSTGHGAKGAEADDVYLLPWSRTALDRLDRLQSGELRLLYVMLTRARKRLHIPSSLLARLPR